MRQKLSNLATEHAKNAEKITKLNGDIERLKLENPQTEEYLELMEAYEALKEQNLILKEELEEWKENDPALVEERIVQIKQLKEQINTWTDNLFAMEDWCVKNMGIERSALKEMFGISDNVDYV